MGDIGDIIKTDEGQRFFDFLDENWGVIKAIYNKSYSRNGGWNGMMDSISKVIEIENEVFNADTMDENEYTDVIEYFMSNGSSY